jgi:uncharacterized coiled-coil protein SlyX
LELLTEGFDEGDLINRLEDQETEHWQEFSLGMERLRIYLSKFHREQYNAIVADSHAEDATLFEFVEACVNCYSANFDPSIIETELAKVRIEHDRLVDGWRDLPTQRAKDVAAERLAVLDTRLGELERKREDLGETVFAHFNEMNDLRQAIADAELAMQSTASERSLRQRAEALRAVVQRIECTFTATGKKGSGWGKKHSRLAKVTIYPVVGDSYEFPTGSKGTLLYSSAHSRM